MIEIKLSETDSIEWALKAFKKKMARSGILRDLRKSRYYVRPSLAKAQKAAEAERRRRSAERKRQQRG